MIVTKSTSIPQWVATLSTSPFYAILSGFDPKDLPGVGTFYDFIARLWNFGSPDLNPHIQPLKVKELKKPKVKGQKAASVDKESVADLIARLSATSFSADTEAYGILFRFFVLAL